jgi:hypothetical protein
MVHREVSSSWTDVSEISSNPGVREEKILVNRCIREDPSKGTMHNRQPITPKLLFQSLRDYDLWPLYILGLMFQTPMTTPTQYLTLVLKGLGFNTFQTNLLTIPSTFIHMITMMTLTYGAEIIGELTLTSMLGQIWALPFLVYLYAVDINSVSKWLAWTIITLLLAYPSGELPFFPPILWDYFPFFFGQKLILDFPSPSHSSSLEQSQLQHRPVAYRLRRRLQHVRAGLRHHRVQHLPRGRRAALPSREPCARDSRLDEYRPVSAHQGVLCLAQPVARQEVECHDRG